MKKQETKHVIYDIRIKEFYSKENGVIYRNTARLIAGIPVKWEKLKTDLKELPEMNYKVDKIEQRRNLLNEFMKFLQEEVDKTYFKK